MATARLGLTPPAAGGGPFARPQPRPDGAVYVEVSVQLPDGRGIRVQEASFAGIGDDRAEQRAALVALHRLSSQAADAVSDGL